MTAAHRGVSLAPLKHDAARGGRVCVAVDAAAFEATTERFATGSVMG